MKTFEDVLIEIVSYNCNNVIATSDGLEAITEGWDKEE